MSGTFPYSNIFTNITMKSNIARLQNITSINKLFEQYKYQKFIFDCSTTSLTRTQMINVMAFLSKQNGNNETFSFPLPRPFSGGAFNNTRNGAFGEPPVVGQIGYAGGQTQLIKNVQSIGDTSVVFYSAAGGTITMSGTYVNSNDSNIVGWLTFKDGDLLQFTNHNKLYQFVGSYTNFLSDSFAGSLSSYFSDQTVNFFPALLSGVTSADRFKTNVSPVVRLSSDITEVKSKTNNLYELKFTLVEEL